MENYCANCGSKLDEITKKCSKCDVTENKKTRNCSRVTAGILGIFLGGFGVHNFYLGNKERGIAQIIVTIFTCYTGSIWGFLEGILILAGSINTDVDGNPLV